MNIDIVIVYENVQKVNIKTRRSAFLYNFLFLRPRRPVPSLLFSFLIKVISKASSGEERCLGRRNLKIKIIILGGGVI